ncbi:uncharacterized protein K460DRAFT_370690 [Cucurbitaria berberidis CBS 394.84]|uniref:EGF-like domain-containing protein n=1 Tax=Cucurbitaria berberidis CBS 394.84 TaxID=1168544 RepID=A0A9P4G8M3_9PLEO|nr:uncharacterized protein K460DRAFT_370690 [Cucurbitaria berberidis CBS 394.84]KAF1840730.1 hypothetical protein K460DRAFT_370690 [Cucurbitaria berberidis CBS 394.84]
MKLILPLVTILIALGSAHPGKKKKPAPHTWDFKFEYLKAKNTLHYLQLSQRAESLKPKVQKRDAQLDPIFDLNPLDEGPTFLPPPWSPHSDLDSPYPLSGVSPWDDSGRSEMLDNEPSVQMWRTCPEGLLDCRKCPRDSKCRRPNLPWWSPANIIDVPGASGADNSNSNSAVCPLDTCSSTSSCGKNARCVRNHCVCKLGFKGATSHGSVVRGFDDLQAVTVWVDSGAACDVPCDTLSCAEVEQVDSCFDNAPETEGDELPGHGLDTDGIQAGAIQVPGAVLDDGGDYVAGVAAAGSFGEAN